MHAQGRDSRGRKLSLMVGEEDIPLHPPFTKEEEARPGLTAIASAASWKSQPPETLSEPGPLRCPPTPPCQLCDAPGT